MGAADAIHAGFADIFVPEEEWPQLIAELEATGDPAAIAAFVANPGPSEMAAQQARIDRLFAADSLPETWAAVQGAEGDLAREAAAAMARNAPLSMAVTLDILRHLRETGADIRAALEQEYRFTARSMEHGDFLEGIRAAIIDKDRNPKWCHAGPDAVPEADIARMRAPLRNAKLQFWGERP